MTKAKTEKPQEQPAAAPAEQIQPNAEAANTEQPKEDNEPDAEQPAAAPDSSNPSDDVEEEQPEDERVLDMKRALRSFPTLPEGYITAKGVYFDKAIAEKSLAEGEELIIVEREK